MKCKSYIEVLFLLIIIFCYSENNAQTPGVWQNYEPVVGNPGISIILADTINKSNLYAGTLNRGLYMSFDYGFNWKHAKTPMDDKNVTSLHLLNNNIYVGTKTKGVFKSEDFGDTWNDENTNDTRKKEITSFVNLNDTVYIGTSDNGIYYKKITAPDWNKANGLSSIKITIMKSFYNVIFAGTDNGIYYGRENLWEEAALLQGKTITSLTSVSDTVVIGTGQGLYYGIKSDEGWSFVYDGGLNNLEITSTIVIINEIYAGTKGSGLWYRERNNTLGDDLENSKGKNINSLLNIN